MKTFVAVLVAIALFSCAPHLSMPAVDIPSEYIYGDVATTDSVGDYWWRIYNDELLDSLELQALKNNKDLTVAALRVESARYSLAIARSSFLPSMPQSTNRYAQRTSLSMHLLTLCACRRQISTVSSMQ